MHERELQFHTKCKAGDMGRYYFLPSDPDCCGKIITYSDNPVGVQSNREYTTYTGTLLGRRVSICSTGIGGPSAVIAMKGLHNIGADTFIRVGTCGDIALPVKSDDVVIITGVVHYEGVNREYAPIEFPVVSDYEVQSALVQTARNLDKPWHAGVAQCKGSFYGQYDPKRMSVSQELFYKQEVWKRLDVPVSETESVASLRCTAALGVRCGSCSHVIWNREREAAGLGQEESRDLSAALGVGIEAVRLLTEADWAAKG